MAKSIHSERFRRIIEAARRKDGEAGTDTMIVNSHLSQMKLFMLRQGIEFYPAQDSYGYRKVFLEQLINENEIDCRLEGIVDDFLIDGKGLFYFRPVDKTYRIIWFNKENYRAYYDAKGELEELELIYSFQIKGDVGALATQAADGSTERYVKLTVKRDTIIETISAEKPSFDIGMGLQALNFSAGQTRTLVNSLGFIPGIECFNTMKSTGMDASGEFDWVAEQIVVHDDLMKNIRTNIHFFGNPTLVSSRPKHDLLETGDEKAMRPSIASQAGFSAMERPSSRSSAPSGASGTGLKIPRIIANIEPTDRAVYLTPDAVSGDHNTYARQYREELLTALGGVDELGISSGATAYEIKSLYGRAATTAARKCRGLLTYGLCKLFSLIIYNEEQIFRDSFAAAAGVPKPVVPIAEAYADSKQFAKDLKTYSEAVVIYKQKIELSIKNAVEQQVMPPNVEGLIPDGDRKVEWRWKGPVFEDGTEDILNNSIVVRNLQELGVNSIEALRYLFPDKTDEERSGMLSGYPFRMAQATQQSIGTFLGLVSQMSQVPHPQAPDVPMLADPKLDLTPYVYRALDFLKRELTYAGKYSDASGATDPTVLGAIDRERARRGLSTSGASAGTTFKSDGSSPDGSGASQQSMAGGVPESGRKPEQSADIPVPGSLLSSDPTGQQSAASGLSLNGGGGLPNNSGTQFGAADLLAPSNAAYSQAQLQQARLAQAQAPAEPQVEVRDGYLNAASLESLKVLKHFGQETPALLNRYSCVLEDALMKQANNLVQLKQEYAGKFAQATDAIKQLREQLDKHKTIIQAAAEDNAAYHIMLTNPSVLSEYVSEFFGKNGPYPVETSKDRLEAEVAASSGGRIAPSQEAAPSSVQTAGYQRPSQDIPTPGVQAGGGEAFWSQFSQLSDKNPAMAWQILNQATPEMLRSKTLVSED